MLKIGGPHASTPDMPCEMLYEQGHMFACENDPQWLGRLSPDGHTAGARKTTYAAATQHGHASIFCLLGLSEAVDVFTP